MNQISPQHYSHLYEAAISDLSTITEGIERQASRPYTRKKGRSLTLYATLDYDSATTNKSADVDAAKLKTFHYTVGGSKYMNQNLIFGGELSYGDGRYKAVGAASQTDATTMTLDAYAAWRKNRWTIGGLALFGLDRYETRRDMSATRLPDVTSSATGFRVGSGLWANYSIPVKYYAFRPYAMVNMMRWRMDSFREKGEDALAIDMKKQEEDIVLSRLGLRVETIFTARNKGDRPYRMYLDLAWASLLAGGGDRTLGSHLYSNTPGHAIYGFDMSFLVPGLKKNGVRGSFGTLAELTDSLSLRVEVTAQSGAGVDTHYSYQASFLYKF
jgi:outer membrane autotransporter protein